MISANIFEFRLPKEIIFGQSCVERLAKEAQKFGVKALLVTGRSALKKAGTLERVMNLLSLGGVGVTLFDEVEPEPCLDTVDRGIRRGRENHCDFIVGLGGGSALDVAKGIAGLINKEKSIYEYHRNDLEIASPGVPFIAIPTTAGTGSEMTSNSVLIDRERKIKKSIRSKYLLAALVLSDPILTLSMPPEITAATGMDALTHAIEAFVSVRAHPSTDVLALQAIKMIGENLRQSVKNGQDIEAREGMATASAIAGMAFANAGLGAVHGLAHPIGAHYPVSHGVINALLLPYVMKYNLVALPGKYARIAKALGEEEVPEKAVDSVFKLNIDLKLPLRLREIGIGEECLSIIPQEAREASSTKYNPRKPSITDLAEIIKEAL